MSSDKKAGRAAADLALALGAKGMTPEGMEDVAGLLLLASASARLSRNFTQDRHEVAHIGAAIIAGNTSNCRPETCGLNQFGQRGSSTSWREDNSSG